MRLAHRAGRKRRALHRAHQPHPLFDVALIRHHAEGGGLHRRAARLGVDEETRLGIVDERERAGEAQRLRPIALRDGRQSVRAAVTG